MGVRITSVLLLSMMMIISSCGENSTTTIKIGLKRIKPKETQDKLKSLTNVDGKIVLKSTSNVAYYAEIGIGTPQQTFRVTFDTGSSDLWVRSSELTLPNLYKSSQSSTYIKNGEVATVSFESFSIQGFLSIDDVTIGPMVVRKQQFIEANVDDTVNNLVVDGVLGLGFQENSLQNSVPLWDNMRTQGLIQQYIFSIWLKYYSPEDEENGVFIFGGFDPTHFKGEHTYVPVTQTVYWEFEMGPILIGGEQTDHCAEGCAAMVDTGYSVVRGPRSIIEDINLAIGLDELGLVDCTKISSMPTVSFTIGGKTFSIFPKDYIEKSSTGEDCTSLFKANAGGGDDDDDDDDGDGNKDDQSHDDDDDCSDDDNHHQGNDDKVCSDDDHSNDDDDHGSDDDDDYEEDTNLWFLGDMFIRRCHIIFDFGESRMGFAEAVQDDQLE